MTCHGNAKAERDYKPAPASPSALRLMPAELLYEALASGAVHAQARQLNDSQRRGVAEYLAGRNLTLDRLGEASRMPNRCASNAPIRSLTQGPAWNGWSPEAGNGRLQSARAAGLTPAQIPRLVLKWAFGLPGATQVYGQPTVVAGRVFVAGDAGYVYAIDAATGCVYWSFQALSAVRTATTVGPVTGQGTTRFAAFFGDQRATIYAVDANDGRLLGGIAAVDLATGKRVWFTPLPGRAAGAGQTAALTLIPGVVLSGGWDGMLRALSSIDGTPLWDFNMKSDFFVSS
jgi:polyvinyl alcohol dehydrogenase (cytochrome)